MSTIDIIPIIISALALIVSGGTAWLNLVRKGTVKMTQPTVIFFGPDGPFKGEPKIFLRTLLFSTAKRSHVVESMYVRLSRGESTQSFNIWVYGDKEVARGSGINVGETGVVCNHHFLLPKDGTNYSFLPGEYTLQVFAKLINKREPMLLFQQTLSLSSEQAELLQKENAGIYFDWGPDSQKYHPHVETAPVNEQQLLRQLLNQSPETKLGIEKLKARTGK